MCTIQLNQSDSNRHLPNLHFRLGANGGVLFEEPGQRGATALLATLLTKDAGKRTAAEVAQFIEEVGGSFSPLSGNNSVGVAAEVLPPDWARALAVIADAVLAPKFAAATFATVFSTCAGFADGARAVT